MATPSPIIRRRLSAAAATITVLLAAACAATPSTQSSIGERAGSQRDELPAATSDTVSDPVPTPAGPTRAPVPSPPSAAPSSAPQSESEIWGSVPEEILLTESSPLDTLPATVSSSWLVVDRLRGGSWILDLANQRLGWLARWRPLGSARSDGFWAISDERDALSLITWDGVVAVDVPIGEDEFVQYEPADGSVVIELRGAETSVYRILERDGSTRCETAPFARRPLWADPLLVHPDGHLMVNIGTCADADMPDIVGEIDEIAVLTPDLVALGQSDVVTIHERTSDRWTDRASWAVPDLAAVGVLDDLLWIESFRGRLILVDLDTFDAVLDGGMACGDLFPRQTAGGIFLVCGAAVIRIDETDWSVARIDLPDDGYSDSAIGIWPVDDGLWLADREQTGEPYFWSFDRQRVERLPDELRVVNYFTWNIVVRPDGP